MANPVEIDCPLDDWTLVAEDVTHGGIYPIHTGAVYYSTYVLTGEAKPAPLIGEGTRLLHPGRKISHSECIDVYVWAQRAAGRVQVHNTLDVIGNDPTGKVLVLPSQAIIRNFVGQPFDLFFQQAINITTLTALAVVDAYTITLDDVTGIVERVDAGTPGSSIGIFQSPRFLFAEALDVTGNVVTLDQPIDFAFPNGSNVLVGTKEMNVNGSVTPQIFAIGGPGISSEQGIDITRILIQITCNAAPDFGKFGDIAGGLGRGLVLRINNGIQANVGNVKTNLEWANVAYDYTVYDASNPGIGVHGLAVRYTLAGQEKHGAAIRLEPSDRLEVIVQDDLSSLLSFRAIAQGHVITL